jgi:hypothetical protein
MCHPVMPAQFSTSGESGSSNATLGLKGFGVRSGDGQLWHLIGVGRVVAVIRIRGRLWNIQREAETPGAWPCKTMRGGEDHQRLSNDPGKVSATWLSS